MVEEKAVVFAELGRLFLVFCLVFYVDYLSLVVVVRLLCAQVGWAVVFLVWVIVWGLFGCGCGEVFST